MYTCELIMPRSVDILYVNVHTHIVNSGFAKKNSKTDECMQLFSLQLP